MSFYNRGYGGLVRFPGLGSLVRFPGLGGFGDVDEATEAVRLAQVKVDKAQADLNKQKKLIKFTEDALRKCTAGPTAVAFLTAGASVAVCVAEQETALGQRRGVLGQFELILSEAKDELKAAKAALAQAKSVPVEEESIPDPIAVTNNGGGGGPRITSTAKTSTSGSGGMFSNPLMIAVVAVPVLGGIAWMLTRKKSSVAGYRRRRNRR